jgi:hypothetical protein
MDSSESEEETTNGRIEGQIVAGIPKLKWLAHHLIINNDIDIKDQIYSDSKLFKIFFGERLDAVRYNTYFTFYWFLG